MEPMPCLSTARCTPAVIAGSLLFHLQYSTPLPVLYSLTEQATLHGLVLAVEGIYGILFDLIE